ncbi:MAG TPA: hypothetical protein VL326_14615 [Kofleriaceae bacterium]|jgi:hypothetical protein|nr:hypothetical protein [Kofleriaceae bacterium]
MRAGHLLWIPFVLTVSCGNKGETKVTRDDCAKVADHVSEVMIEHYTAHPDQLWMEVDGKDTGLPATVTKDTFATYLSSPDGKTWLLQRRGFVRSAMEPGVDACVAKASRKQVDCLLKATSREAVTACDSVK